MDVISRQQAIDVTWQDTGYTDPFNVMTAIRDRIEQLPPIQPEPHWIPVEQAFPEYGEEVLTITKDNIYEVNHIIDDEYDEWSWEENGKPIAWMPLPEAYKGATE